MEFVNKNYKEMSAALDNSSTIASTTTITDKVTVYVSVVFLKLGDIETAQERFAAEVLIRARWRLPALDLPSKERVNEEFKDWAQYWNPKLIIENSVANMADATHYMLSYDKNGRAEVIQKRRVKGLFFEKMELELYPFDNQDLKITVVSELDYKEVALACDPCDVSSVNQQSFVDEQEWELHNHINAEVHETHDLYMQTKHPSLSVSCLASRRYKFFMWNIVLVMMFICSLEFVTFSISPAKVENRLQVSFLLVLSIISFKTLVSNTLPKIPYLTYLDKYVLMCLAWLVLICLWHGISAHVSSSIQVEVDWIALCILGAIYIIVNVCFFTWIRVLIQRRRKLYRLYNARYFAGRNQIRQREDDFEV